MAYCLAIDIGASSGRFILGRLLDGALFAEEIYRFDNGVIREGEALAWDMERIFSEIICGLKKCRELGKIPSTVAIDTWGVDYVLLDAADKPILPVYSYRDSRGERVAEELHRLVPKEELYSRTGVAPYTYNTVYQLYADKLSGRLEKASRMLMIPEYLGYRLTGKMLHEYTEATTSGLVSASTGEWDYELAARLGYPERLFGKIHRPSTLVGEFCEEVRREVGFSSELVLCPSHDTASAMLAAPTKGDGMFISSGTWSLVGVETDLPITSRETLECGFTNEGGAHGVCFLKNIMGMWLLQSIRRELSLAYSYDELMRLAMTSSYTKAFDPQDSRLLAPESMLSAIRECLGEKELSPADTLSATYHSLARSYALTRQEIMRITGKEIRSVTVVGGGAKDGYLTSLTERECGVPVQALPVECTAAGNLLSQFSYLDTRLTEEKIRGIFSASYK